jgi:hypothetical protein
MTGGDIKKAELIRTGRVIDPGLFDRIAGIAQADEIDALDHAAVFHVQAGDDTNFKHECLLLTRA